MQVRRHYSDFGQQSLSLPDISPCVTSVPFLSFSSQVQGGRLFAISLKDPGSNLSLAQLERYQRDGAPDLATGCVILALPQFSHL